MTFQEALKARNALVRSKGRHLETLNHKCRREAMTRLAVLMRWGHPREWPMAEETEP